MSFKVFATFFVVIFVVYGSALTLPEPTTKPQDPELPETTKPQDPALPETTKPQDPALPETTKPQDPALPITNQETVTQGDTIHPDDASHDKVNEQSDAEVNAQAPCGGGCVSSGQCQDFSGKQGCRCTWFECKLYTAEADLTDVEQFEIFIQQFSGTAVLKSAEQAYRTKHQA